MRESHFYKKLFSPEVEKKTLQDLASLPVITEGLLVFFFPFFLFSYLTSVVSIEIGNETQQLLFANWL